MIILESGKAIVSDWVSFYDEFSIEGTGGREDKENTECIKLRIVYKEPDDSIRLFYAHLQKVLKNIEGIKCHKLNNFNQRIYYRHSDKMMWSDFIKKLPSTIMED